MAWDDEPATYKQLQAIKELQEVSKYHLPEFTGKTKGDAEEYLKSYRRIVEYDKYRDN